MDAEQYIRHLKGLRGYKNQIVHIQEIPAREAVYGELEKPLAPCLRSYLERIYGKGRWRTMKGMATVRLADGAICEAEIHWFEAHGIGRKDLKIKRTLQ